MQKHSGIVANWGNYPKIKADISAPENPAEAREVVLAQSHLIARGNGKCYGDAALSPQILSTLGLKRLLAFDPAQGIVQAEAGILLADLLDTIVPAGWFFQVTPGIKYITLGGAIASDVHGKNHPAKGCFSNWLLDFELLQADGTVLNCSRTENTSLFWQTCGGMGWTGVILSARFQLMRLPGIFMRQKAVRAGHLEGLFQAFDDHCEWPYAAGWVDALSGGKAVGRGVVYFADHAPADPNATDMRYPHQKARNIPLFAPAWLLNPLSIRLHNSILFDKAKTSEQLVDLDHYFYPLDRIRNWNRLYGRRGFIQYQFCLPEAQSFEGIRQILETIRRSRDLPFLSVLKRHGDRAPEALHSFPIRGYSLALDFPFRTSVLDLVRELDELVWRHGGKIYLSKDACSAPKMGRIDPASFGEAKFQSLLKARLLNAG
ncbi:MAG: FAD-binding oxidoreductase [Saprospiraceae bacterium]|nr:FAD-binding oxidoreductase [Saprospiraceae bacterium]